jgi:hypothetical protein
MSKTTIETARVILITPDGDVKTITTDNFGLEFLQGQLGGAIEPVYHFAKPGFMPLTNEEGHSLGLDPQTFNGEVFAGNVVIVGDSGVDFRGLTDEEIDRAKEVYGL